MIIEELKKVLFRYKGILFWGLAALCFWGYCVFLLFDNIYAGDPLRSQFYEEWGGNITEDRYEEYCEELRQLENAETDFLAVYSSMVKGEITYEEYAACAVNLNQQETRKRLLQSGQKEIEYAYQENVLLVDGDGWEYVFEMKIPFSVLLIAVFSWICLFLTDSSEWIGFAGTTAVSHSGQFWSKAIVLGILITVAFLITETGRLLILGVRFDLTDWKAPAKALMYVPNLISSWSVCANYLFFIFRRTLILWGVGVILAAIGRRKSLQYMSFGLLLAFCLCMWWVNL